VFSDAPDDPSGTRKTRNSSPIHNAIDSMIRILSALTISAFAMLAASCCCTSDTRPPGLRPLPQFQELPAAPAPEVHRSSK